MHAGRAARSKWSVPPDVEAAMAQRMCLSITNGEMILAGRDSLLARARSEHVGGRARGYQQPYLSFNQKSRARPQHQVLVDEPGLKFVGSYDAADQQIVRAVVIVFRRLSGERAGFVEQKLMRVA